MRRRWPSAALSPSRTIPLTTARVAVSRIFTASFEALIEDFSAAVDFLGTKSFVNRERIGVIGICGSGSFGLAAAETDSRIKAVATVSMYDIGQAHRQGLSENVDTAALKKNLAEISKQRWAEVDGAERTMGIGTPQT